jgi:hypothetical protein
MKPVRVTTQGASPVLPLRMVAAGAGATVPITLWVLGEGNSVPSNFPWFTIPEDKLVWNWDNMESNYKSLREEGFIKTSNTGWLVEAGEPISQVALLNRLLNLVHERPEQSGYTADKDKSALQVAEADIYDLIGSIPPTALTLTRIHAELPKLGGRVCPDAGGGACHGRKF